MSIPTIGFVGLGLMGSGFTERLIEQGFTVYGYDKIEEKLDAASANGVLTATDPADLARRVNQVHICVMTSDDLNDAVFGAQGIANAASGAKLVIDHSTTPVETTQSFAQRLKQQAGMDWIDAPVSGGPAAASKGTLAIMAGGQQQVIEQVMPVLNAMGSCTHMGDVGAGQVTKMVNQILVLNNYCILAESLALAEAGGVEPDKIPDALAQGHAGSNLLHALYPRMIERDYEPAGYAFQVLKDLKMVDDLAQSHGVPIPMSKSAMALFQKLNDNGDGNLDGISVLKLYLKNQNQ